MSNNPYKSLNDSDTASREPRRVRLSWGGLLAAGCVVGLLIALLLPATRRGSREAARRMGCGNNLKQIALALHQYRDEYQCFPPAYTVDSDGRALHSWRTLILPYLEAKPIYDSIDLSKPWDHPANASAYQASPNVFRCPSNRLSPGLTTYVALVANDGCLHPTRGRRFSEIADPATTLMLIEIPLEDAVHWMAPRDTDAQFVLDFDQDTEFAHPGGTQGALADASVQFFSAGMSMEARLFMISIAAHDGATEDQFEGSGRSETPRSRD